MNVRYYQEGAWKPEPANNQSAVCAKNTESVI